MPREKRVHGRRRAGAYLENVQTWIDTDGVEHAKQPLEVRRGVRALLPRVPLAAFVERRHRRAHIGAGHVRRQIGLECVARSVAAGSTHFCA